QALDAEVLADVVTALDAARADAARVVGDAGHARADLPAERGRALPQLDDLAAPLVPRDQRPLLGPEARIVALDDVRVGAADRHRAHLAQQLEPARARALDVAHGELVGRRDDEGAHQVTATGSTMEPVAPRMASGS